VLRTGTIYETGELLVAITEKIDRETLKGRTPYVLTQGIPPTNTITLAPGEPSEKGPEPTAAMNYCNFVKKVKKENITCDNIGEIMLCQIPGIQSKYATAVLLHFGSFSNMIEGLKEGKADFSGITYECNGKKRKIPKSCGESIVLYLQNL
jgi:ERCC4-type nuclease